MMWYYSYTHRLLQSTMYNIWKIPGYVGVKKIRFGIAGIGEPLFYCTIKQINVTNECKKNEKEWDDQPYCSLIRHWRNWIRSIPKLKTRARKAMGIETDGGK